MTFINVRLFTILFLLFLAVSAFAETGANSVSIPTESTSINLDEFTSIGQMTTLGVVAKAYIDAIDPASGLDATHRVVVTFANEKTKVTVKKADVGIKHRKLFGAASQPVWMKASDKQPDLFTAYVSLNKRGRYLIIVGSKLEDNKKRQFTFEFSY
jgi:hypothetical protein